MTNRDLPDGVPSSNDPKEREAMRFAAPDMATPRFDPPNYPDPNPGAPGSTPAEPQRPAGQAQFHAAAAQMRGEYARATTSGRSIMLWISAIALLIALSGFLTLRGGERLPLCSSQPDWNQFNCRTG